MRVKFVIPVLASVLILGVIAISYDDVFAMKQKIVLSDIDWNKESQSFVVTGIVHHGIAKAAQNADFRISITLTVSGESAAGAPFTVDLLATQGLNQLLDNSPNVPVGTFHQNIPWDRNSGTFEGFVDTIALGELFHWDWNKKFSFGDDYSEESIEASASSSPEVCNDGIDNDEDGSIDCQDSDCLIDPVCVQEQP